MRSPAATPHRLVPSDSTPPPPPPAQRIRLQKTGGPPPSTTGQGCCGRSRHHAVECMNPAPRAQPKPLPRDETDSGSHARKRKAGIAVGNGFIFVRASSGARHARKCKAESPLVDGLILGFDSPRLFTHAVDLAGRSRTKGNTYLSPNSPCSICGRRLFRWRDHGPDYVCDFGRLGLAEIVR